MNHIERSERITPLLYCEPIAGSLYTGSAYQYEYVMKVWVGRATLKHRDHRGNDSDVGDGKIYITPWTKSCMDNYYGEALAYTSMCVCVCVCVRVCVCACVCSSSLQLSIYLHLQLLIIIGMIMCDNVGCCIEIHTCLCITTACHLSALLLAS